MPRYRWLRKRLIEITESSTVEKVLFVLPLFILALDLYMLNHAVSIRDINVIIPALILFIFSVIEILVAIDEIRERTLSNSLNKNLESKIKSVIRKSVDELTVKSIMEKTIEKYPELKGHKSELYHIVCQILSKDDKKIKKNR